MNATPPEDPQSGPSGPEDHRTAFAVAWRAFRRLVIRTLRIEDNAEPYETIESIKNDIDFKGYNIWVLIFSIFIASIGLNVNSPAVVIGAMLISPLMGPILGVGLSIGINDWLTMKRSLRNFVTMFTVSIITSTIYFSLTPLVDAQSELLARTRPTLLDVFVAFFGGLAGILAANRRIKSNVIPGVAIATALMPPLCTAGFGLATGQWNFFFGAFYLFLINSIFIALATFVIVRFLRFPIKEFVDPVREKKTRRYLVTVLLVIVVPSTYTFYNVVTESYLNRRVEQYIRENLQYEGSELVKREVSFEGEQPQIDLVFFGESIPEKVLTSWRQKLALYGLEGAKLNIVQPKNASELNSAEMGKLVNVFSDSRAEIVSKERRIAELEKSLESYRRSELPTDQILTELSINHHRLDALSLGRLEFQNREGFRDTLYVADLHWRGEDTVGLQREEAIISRWLKVRLGVEQLELRCHLPPAMAAGD